MIYIIIQKIMLIKNGKVILFKADDVSVENKDIRIENDIIKQIEDNIESQANEKVIDASNKVVMPGLINTHAHITMSIFRGTFEGCNLYTWLHEKIWPIEAELAEDQVYDATMLSILEMISTGTTCVNDHYFFSKKIRQALEESKMRAVLTRVLMDSDGKEASEQRINEFIDLYETRDKNNNLITYTVSPHSLYTCSDALLEKSKELAIKYNLPIHTHFLESIDEIEDIQKLHGEEASKVLKKYFDGIHLILAHCVKLNDEDIEILKTLDCGIAHNPISNFRLGCKIADTTKYLKNGINVALGTDGQGSGNNLDMFEAMKVAALSQGGIYENEKFINSRDVLKMATINGAKLLGLDKEIGSIEEGKKADLIIVDIAPKLDNIKMVPNNDVISNLVYNIEGRNVETTIVNGEILMENRKFVNLNVEKIIEKMKK
mgnify:FL=1